MTISSEVPFKIPKKLIEVALPLDLINTASAREKSIRHGHPSTLHLWWARRPLAAARAVIFAQMVNDPGYERHLGRGVNKAAANAERERLFDLMGKLVQWENTNNEAVLNEARAEIRKSWEETCRLNKDHPRAAELFAPEKLPAFHDPFAGGGSIPLEAQRLGLVAHASDLNPVAVTINKAMIEIPPKFAGRAPVGPVPKGDQAPMTALWCGAQGLAEDVRRYGHWMRGEAIKRIGHMYPEIEVTAEIAATRPELNALVGQNLTVIAWLWARTVKSPSPAYSNVLVPLASSFVLSNKEDKHAYVEPVISPKRDAYDFKVRTGKTKAFEEAKSGTAAGKWNAFRCIVSGSPISYDYIRAEGMAGRLGSRMMVIVAEGKGSRVYLSPTSFHEQIASSAEPTWIPDLEINHHPRDIKTQIYGLMKYGDLFTPRQLVSLDTLSTLVAEAVAKCEADALAAGMVGDGAGLDKGGVGARAYAEAVGVCLSFVVSRAADRGSTICSWDNSPKMEALRNTFGRQAIPMTWDYCEGNPFSGSSGSWTSNVDWVSRVIAKAPCTAPGYALQLAAQSNESKHEYVISTDPPYYDNIGYADLSDFFYVWLRRSLKPIFPDLYATMAVPKSEELVATPYRHGGKESAEKFFMDGMTQAITRLAEASHPAFPVTIYYAFKQAETKEGATSSTGWETFLAAVIQAGFSLVGTWPMRTEMANRMISSGANALASSVVLVCQRRAANALSVSRRDFIRELRTILPQALEDMTLGSKDASPIAPVDLAQAAIGPGMAVFSRYSAIIDGGGQPMSVKTALALINKEVDAYFNHGEGDLDSETRFCLDWFAQYGWKVGEFGTADTLARAKGTSVDGVRDSGVVEAAGGKVRLLKPVEYPPAWDPTTDERLPVWEALHQLIRVYQAGGEREAAGLLRLLGTRQEAIRTVAYRLYTECERKGWAEDARAYNELVVGWEHIERALERLREEMPSGQLSLF